MPLDQKFFHTLNHGFERAIISLLSKQRSIWILTLITGFWGVGRAVVTYKKTLVKWQHLVPRSEPISPVNSSSSHNLPALVFFKDLLMSWQRLETAVNELHILGLDQRPDADEEKSLIVECNKCIAKLSSKTELSMYYLPTSGWNLASQKTPVHKRLSFRIGKGGNKAFIFESAKADAIDKEEFEIDLLSLKTKDILPKAVKLWRQSHPLWQGPDCARHYLQPALKESLARIGFLAHKGRSKSADREYLLWRKKSVLTLSQGRWQELPLGVQTRGQVLARLDAINANFLNITLWDELGVGSQSIQLDRQSDALDLSCLSQLQLIAARSRDRFALKMNEITIPITLGSWLLFEDKKWRGIDEMSLKNRFEQLHGQLLVFHALFKKNGLWRVRGQLFSAGRSLMKTIELAQQLPQLKPTKPQAKRARKKTQTA